MAYEADGIEHLQLNNYIGNSIRDSDTEYQTESDSDTDTSDTDVDDTDIADVSLENFQNKNCPKYYKCLTPPQKKAFRQICNLFANKKNQIVTMNARSGTGKTFVLASLAKNYPNAVQFLTFRRDQASEMKFKLNNYATTYTYISFYVNCFQLRYYRAVQLFNVVEADDTDLLYKLILNSKKYLHTGTKVIMVDSCTLPSATMLLMLYIISLKHQMHLIFAGNKLQLSAMHKSSVHNRCNFDIIKLLSNMTVRRLSDKRLYDKVLTDKISQFRRLIQQGRQKNEVPFLFNLRYFLYCCFRVKYFAEERFDIIYIAQFHQNITDRVKRFIGHLEASGIKYFVAPYCTKQQAIFEPISTKQDGKFYPGLVLVEGYKYIHINQYGVHSVVLLEKIISPDYVNVLSLDVRFLETNERARLFRIELNYYQILPALRSWLVNDREEEVKLYQFPLRPYTLTYHAALGKTIDSEKVELSADCSFANAIYVGLCCIRKYDDINKIHAANDLPNFVLTDYMRKEKGEEKYYYRCPSPLDHYDENKIMRYVYAGGINGFIENIQWSTAKNVQDFEKKKSKYYTRIPCSFYEKPKKKSEQKGDTRLMKIVDFVKNNPNVILDTIANAPVGDLAKYINKKTQSAELKKSNVYVSLKEKYTNWSAREE